MESHEYNSNLYITNLYLKTGCVARLRVADREMPKWQVKRKLFGLIWSNRLMMRGPLFKKS